MEKKKRDLLVYGSVACALLIAFAFIVYNPYSPEQKSEQFNKTEEKIIAANKELLAAVSSGDPARMVSVAADYNRTVSSGMDSYLVLCADETISKSRPDVCSDIGRVASCRKKDASRLYLSLLVMQYPKSMTLAECVAAVDSLEAGNTDECAYAEGYAIAAESLSEMRENCQALAG